MASLTPFFITGYSGGFQNNKKPFLLPDQAWAILENSYCFRERELKREGRKLLGRLRRVLTALAESNTTGAGTFTQADLLSSVRGNEPQAEIEPGSVVFRIDPGGGTQTVYTDPAGDGVLVRQSGPYTISKGRVNYITGQLDLTFTAPPGALTTNVDLNYFPTLPVMGIAIRELVALNAEQTIWFDEIYAYIWNGTDFQEFIPGTTWLSSDSDFFWPFNYRGAAPQDKLLFVTNFVATAANPMRYTDGSTWTDFAPIILDAPNPQQKLYQARILVAYYGRLLALNVWEGTTAGGVATAVNIQNRCRFSTNIGSPIAVDAWRTDIFGKGGVIDAPTAEAITGATFIRNTLVVDFETTTWQLRYVGEYGFPFVWERVSADFGSESTFSGVLFDNHRLAVGDKAITAATSIAVDRIDLDIPNQVFDFKNSNNGVKRIWGIRDYQKELVFWNYPDAQTEASPTQDLIFPNKVLLYNYRNNTWAIFRDSITAFGTFQSSSNITWDSLTTFWDSETTLWDDVDNQSLFPIIVCGDQQGYVSCYGDDSPSQHSTVNANDQETLTIQAVDLVTTPITITSVNHNLQDAEIIYITGLLFQDSTTYAPVATDLNDKIYSVQILTKDTFRLLRWNFTTKQYENNFSFTPVGATSTYVGGGQITLFPKLNMLSKDINLFQQKSLQTKLSRLDFLFQAVPDGAVTIKLFLNSSADGSTPGVVGDNNLVWKGNLTIDAKPPFYTPGSDYSWFRFYATLAAQYFSINITYDDDLMNTFATHSQDCTLYAINAMCRPGGKNVY